MKRWLKEPLLHFLLIGAGLFLLWGDGPDAVPAGQAMAPSTEIVVTPESLRSQVEFFEKTWQHPPTASDMQALVDSYVRDEIFYREAVAAGLDRDDSVIRRRLRMKMEFLFEDAAALGEPTDQELKTYLDKHAQKYLAEPRLAFRQVFINADRRGARAEEDAREMLARLRSGVAVETVGDATMLEPDVRLSPLRELNQQFGETFGQQLVNLKPRRWEGPLRSAFGLHLVYVEQREDGRTPELAEIRERVRQDWAVSRQQELKDAAFARLKERYTVTIDLPATTKSTAAVAAGTKAVN